MYNTGMRYIYLGTTRSVSNAYSVIAYELGNIDVCGYDITLSFIAESGRGPERGMINGLRGDWLVTLSDPSF